MDDLGVDSSSSSTSHDDIVMVVFEVLLALTFLFGSVLNTILVAVFVRRRGFRSQISNRFLLNLVISNLFSCWLFTPILMLDGLMPPSPPHSGGSPTSAIWSWSNPDLQIYICSVFTIISVITSSTSVLSQVLIGLDQYFAVVDPLHYHHKITKYRCHLLCVAVWIVSLALGLLSITDFQNWAYGIPTLPLAFNTCRRHQEDTTQDVSALVYAILTFIIPFGILSFCYTRIFCAAHENSVKTRRNSVCSTNFETLNNNNNNNVSSSPYYGYRSTYLGVSMSRSPSVKSTGSNIAVFTSNLKTSMRHKISNASAIFTYREEGRAAKVTVLVLVMILACWGPYFCLGLVETFTAGLDQTLPSWVGRLVLVLASSSSVLSPLLYAYRSRRVQRDIKRVLGMTNPAVFSGNNLRQARQRKIAKMQRMKSFSCPQLLISSAAENCSPKTKSTLNKFGLLNRSVISGKTKSPAAAVGSSVPLKRRRPGVIHVPNPRFFVIGEAMEKDLGGQYEHHAATTERSPMLEARLSFDESSGASSGTTTTQVGSGFEDEESGSSSSGFSCSNVQL